MDYGIIKIWDAVVAAAGWKVAILVVLTAMTIIALVRLAPSWLADRRARDAQEGSDRREAGRALQARLDAKDAMLEKILTNHIAHLEIQLAASREFYEVAAERLSTISQEMKDAQDSLREIHGQVNEIKEDTTVLRDRH